MPDAPVGSPEAPAAANGSAKPAYEWDRTAAEREQREKDAIISRTPFPMPDAKTLPFPKFCAYWNALIEQPVSKYARIYVRRWFPCLLPEEIEDAQSGLTREAHPSEKKYTKDDGPLDEKKILSDIGVGDYTFRLNDTRRPWDQATIVHGEKLSTMRNWDLYPPVFDKPRLDWDDDANKVYIKWAQSRNFLPQERDIEKEQSDMANEQIVTQLLQQNKQLTDQVVNSSAKPAQPAAPTPPPKSENGDGGAIKAVVEFATTALNRPAPAVAPAADPMVLVKGMVDLVKEIKPAPDTAATDLAKQVVTQAQAANDRIYQLQKEQMEQMRTELKEAKAAPATVVAPPAPKTLVEQFQELEALTGAAKRIARGGSASDEEEKPSNVDKWLELAPLVAPIANGIIGGFFGLCQFGLQTWQQISYNNALAKNGDAKLPTNMEKTQVPEPGKPIPPQVSPEQQAQQARVILMLQSLEGAAEPIANAIDDGDTGAQFAALIIKMKRRPAYDMIRGLGEKTQGVYDFELFKTNLWNLLQHPSRGPQTAKLWEKVAPLSTFGQFLLDFFNYDQIAEQEPR